MKYSYIPQYTKAVLGAFSSLKLDDVSASKTQDEPPTDKHVFFAKYLTSEKVRRSQYRQFPLWFTHESPFSQSVLWGKVNAERPQWFAFGRPFSQTAVQ